METAVEGPMGWRGGSMCSCGNRVAVGRAPLSQGGEGGRGGGGGAACCLLVELGVSYHRSLGLTLESPPPLPHSPLSYHHLFFNLSNRPCSFSFNTARLTAFLETIEHSL